MSVSKSLAIVLLGSALALSSACKSQKSSGDASKAKEKPAATSEIFEEALQAVLAQKAPANADNKAYGCSVKYGADSPAPTQVAQVGQEAPDFELEDLEGKKYKLSELRGKTVVLEWYNPECPFVEYAYKDGPLKGRAQKSKEKVLWLNINSGAPGKQGTGKENNSKHAKSLGVTQPILLDESGSVGRAYGAKATPQMFIINAKGILVYRGALDNAPMGKVKI